MKFVLIFLTFQCSHSYTVSKHFDENLRWGFCPWGTIIETMYRNDIDTQKTRFDPSLVPHGRR